MPATGWLRRNRIELLWALFAFANWAAMIRWPSWETIPFHFVWISLTLLYGFRVWRAWTTNLILGAVILFTGASIFADAFAGLQLWGELFEVPLMSAMFLAMVWHARRRQAAMRVAEALLERQEAFLQDVSHELRTPVTIARGHLELLSWERPGSPELRVTLDELDRMERIIDRLLLLAKTEQPGFLHAVELDLDAFVSDVFLRWSGVAPRTWQLDVEPRLPGVHADPETLRVALDALIENAVKYSEPGTPIRVGARRRGSEVVVEVADAGLGIPADARDRVFERFSRVDEARTRAGGGVGLGLAIVQAIAQAHGGRCTVDSSSAGSTFALHLPGTSGGRVEVLAAAVPGTD